MPTDEDPEPVTRTRLRLLTEFADIDTFICAMHLPAPSAGYFRRWHDGFRLELVEPRSHTPRRWPGRTVPAPS